MKKAVCILLFLAVLSFAAVAFGESPALTPDAAAGDIAAFGCYEQDGDPGNGPEPVEWIVLDVQDGKALLLSRYALDAKPFDAGDSPDAVWETCSLRAWLNGDFLNLAFSAEEQALIPVTEVDNSPAQGYGGWPAPGGNATRDRIFLLSCAEAEKYLGVQYMGIEGASDNVLSRVSPTAYATGAGAWSADYSSTAEGGNSAMWWLRSPGEYDDVTALVYHDGSLTSYYSTNAEITVRPALWVDLNAGSPAP